MNIVRAKVKRELLIWARTSAGYTQDDIARFVNVTEQDVQLWESGRAQPTIRQLELVAQKVKRPLAALFLQCAPHEPPPPKDYRRLPASSLGKFSPPTLLAIREARNIQAQAVELMDLVGEHAELRIPEFSIRGDAERLAKEIRNTLGITIQQQMGWPNEYAALREWRESLAGMGVLVIQLSMPRTDARGFSILDDKLSVIAVSNDDAVVARIFSVFHEFCHLSLRHPGISNPAEYLLGSGGPKSIIETFCNRFAAAFLLPLEDPAILDALKELAASQPLDEASVAQFARKLKVSKFVVLGRLLSGSFIDQSSYERTFSLWSRQASKETLKRRSRGGGPLPHVLSVSERGIFYSNLVFDALDSNQISLKDASRYLSLNFKWLDQARAVLVTGGADA